MKFLKKTWSALYEATIKRIGDSTGVTHAKYGLPTVIMVAVIIAILTFVILGFGASISKHIENITDKTLAAASAAILPSTEPQSNDPSKNCVLDQGRWSVWSGLANRDVGGYSLPRTSQRALFSYDQPVDKSGVYTVAFVPEGDVINFSLLMPNFYEIVIGDGDYQTISFKSSDALNTPPNNLIKDTGSVSVHPMLTHPIKRGTEVQVRAQESNIDGRFMVGAEVIYVPDFGNNPEPLRERFEFKFTPPSLPLRSKELVIGIFRSKTDGAKQVQLQFICPRNP